MEKKQYIAPTMECFQLKNEAILAASLNSNIGITDGGNASDNGTTVTDAKFFDEDDDYWE